MTDNGEDRPEWMPKFSPQHQDPWDYLLLSQAAMKKIPEGLDKARNSSSGGPSHEELEARLGFVPTDEGEGLRRIGSLRGSAVRRRP